jgi:signal transduction histidine kinase
MRFEQLRTLLRSLRFRLSAWNTAAVLLIVIVTLLAVREALRFTLLRENDAVLLDETYEVALAIEGFYPDLDEVYKEMERKALGHVDRALFVQLLDAGGNEMSTSGKPPDLKNVALPVSGEPSLLTVRGYRLAQRMVTKPRLPAYTVRVGASLTMVNNDVAIVTRLMTAAGIAILFVAPISGYFLAGRATRPLARIITTAARLRPSHLEERLPIRGSQDELDQLSLTINHFLDLLRDYLERNQEFVANAAHELRSPLAAVQSSVEVTLNSDRSVEEYKDMLWEVADQCGQLGALVNQLLLLAETDPARSPLSKQPVRMDQLVMKSVEMFRGAAEERGIELTVDVRGQVTIDGRDERLRQVVNNLIDNSLKFTPSGGQVVVSLRNDAIQAQVVLKVADTGSGIGPDDLPHVFERFYCGDKSRQRENSRHGNGLGLSICQSIVANYGGKIRVESSLGRGAIFTVTLPVGRTHAAVASESTVAGNAN